MSTKIPVTIKGNLTADPEHDTSPDGTPYTRFTVAVNARRRDETTGQWEDTDTVFHRAVAFDEQARNIATSLRKGDHVIVEGNLRFSTYTDKDTGQPRESRDLIADTVGASLRFTTVAVQRTPKVSGPAAEATGPVAEPAATGYGVAR
tara:strand:+ start:227 stop:670 length:444 start_codon:yes stop_codon:yes gene_type:complete